MIFHRKRIEVVVAYSVLVVASLVAIFPVVLIVLNSFKLSRDIFAIETMWIFKPTLANYRSIFVQRDFFLFLKNSLIVSSGATLLSLVFAIPAGYGFSRYEFRGKKDLLFWILSQKMIPPIAIIIPYFIIIKTLHLIDTYLALVVTYLVLNLPFAVWILHGFFNEIPSEIDDAARVDGCSELQILVKIIFPLAIGGIVTTAILCVVFSWNEFVFALILCGLKTKTAPVITTALRAPYGMGWGDGLAAASVTIVPVILFVMILGKRFLKGLTFGAIQ